MQRIVTLKDEVALYKANSQLNKQQIQHATDVGATQIRFSLTRMCSSVFVWYVVMPHTAWFRFDMFGIVVFCLTWFCCFICSLCCFVPFVVFDCHLFCVVLHRVVWLLFSLVLLCCVLNCFVPFDLLHCVVFASVCDRVVLSCFGLH